jgi:prepilin-type N-terminal cleavage/methylation domain-containing protein
MKAGNNMAGRELQSESIGIGDARGAPDEGFTFVEVLVAIVLIGIATVGTMTALQVSLRGSDQHRSRVSALADLQSAGAYLAREGHSVVCPGATAAEVEDLLADMPGSRNTGITVVVNGAPNCASGLPRVSLVATHQNGRARESLDVVIGGITVLSPGGGSGGGGPGPGPCTWGQVSLGVTYPLTASGNGVNAKLNQSLPVKLSYTGDCSSVPAGSITATVTAQVKNGDTSATAAMSNSGSGIFEVTFANNALRFASGSASITINGASVPGLPFEIG